MLRRPGRRRHWPGGGRQRRPTWGGRRRPAGGGSRRPGQANHQISTFWYTFQFSSGTRYSIFTRPNLVEGCLHFLKSILIEDTYRKVVSNSTFLRHEMLKDMLFVLETFSIKYCFLVLIFISILTWKLWKQFSLWWKVILCTFIKCPKYFTP